MFGGKGAEIKKTIISITGLGVLLVILVMINVIFSYANLRWDATEDRIYSLSEGTKNILSDLKEPVTINFFYSKSSRDFPASLKLYARRVGDMLTEYEQAADGMIELQYYDPKPDSDEEEWAQLYGIRPAQLPGGEKIYCGLVFLSGDREQRIEMLDPSREELLEYDLTLMISRVQTSQKKVVGLITNLPVFGAGPQAPMQRPGGGPPWFFVSELKKTYELRQIPDSATVIDPDIDLLVLIHPKDLSPALQYAVDQYLLDGGNILAYVDPVCVSDQASAMRNPMMPSSSSPGKLLDSWGIEMDLGGVVADLDNSTKVRANETVEDNPAWITVRNANFNKTEPVISKLESILLPLAGGITKSEESACEFTPLIVTSSNAAVVEPMKARLTAAIIRKDISLPGKKFNLAAHIRGKFKSAFPEGSPAEASEAGQAIDHKAEGIQNASVIVVADADMLADHFYLQRGNLLGFDISKMFNDNLNFLVNACEVLTGSAELINLRSRGKYERPFTAVMELERSARERWLSKEKELVRKMEETNRKLQELQQHKDESQKLILSVEQEKEIARFKEEKRRINSELKEVRKKLRQDIDRLGLVLEAVNIFLMPLCVALAGLGFALYRQARMKRR
ncbi:MAG: Gldg family protein [Desulfatiglandaceae bacterium]